MPLRLFLTATALAASAIAVAATRDEAVAAAKVELGRRLFYDADLSVDGTMACATCHEQRRGFTDGNATHPGVTGEAGRRNVPGLANVAARNALTWGDPRIRTLEAQAAVPLFGEHPVEMGMKRHEAEIGKRLGGDACYRAQFRAAFPESGAIDTAHVVTALAAFQRTMISRGAPYDRYRAGQQEALSAPQRAGLRAFATHGCAACHSGADLTDDRFHAIAPPVAGARDRGLAEVTGRAADNGRFKTPALRNVAVSAPYLHDGSAATLGDAIRRHDAARGLDDATIAALTDFLTGLTDAAFLRDPRLSLPPPGCPRPLSPAAAWDADRAAARRG